MPRLASPAILPNIHRWVGPISASDNKCAVQRLHCCRGHAPGLQPFDARTTLYTRHSTLFRFVALSHSLSGLSGLHLMQQHNLSGNNELLTTRGRRRSNDTKTPPHTEISKYGGVERNDKSLRHTNASEQLKSLSSKSNASNNNNNTNNNNNNSKEPVSVSGALAPPLQSRQFNIMLFVWKTRRRGSGGIGFRQDWTDNYLDNFHAR